MELEISFGHKQQSGMDEQDRVSQASSVVTVLSTRDQTDKKPQSFCKRSRSVQRDPNCAVVIRGWLYKRDSTGLKLWKRRWFVLSNYCLFYYKDSREECVLGSLPLPSYKIFFCSPRECKNRKYAFKVVHQGMRSYFFSAETQEDMLGWVRALNQSACMENDDLINRRCSSYHDFSQLGGSSESVNPFHLYRTQNNPSHCTAGGEDMADHMGRHRATQNSGIRTRSLSLDRIGEDHFLYQGSGPSTPRSHYESRSHSPLVRGDLRPQVYSTHYSLHKAESKGINSDQLPPLPPSRITHNVPDPFHHSTVSGEKESHTITALQGDTDMVLTCLCGCDKVLQTLSVELDLLQQDKEHAEFALDMSRIELGEGKLKEYHVSQKALLQEELVTIRARMCDISREMEKVWLDYKRMESELCVFRSHLEHICHFGLPQERSLAQKQIWMMDDILSGLKPNRSRFKTLMVLHTPTMFPLLDNSPLHPEKSMHYWGEELEPPARPPLPFELDSTSDWAEPNCRMVYKPSTMNTHSSTHTNMDTAESLCLDEESDHPKEMHWKFDKNKLHHKKRIQIPDHQMSRDDKPHTLTKSSPVCVMHVMRAELPSALTAQRVCVEESNPEEDELNTLIDNNNVEICALNRESSFAMTSEQRHAKLKRVERIRERVLKSALRRSDSAHPLKFVGVREPGQRSTGSVQTDPSPSPLDISPSSTNHISTLTINNMASEETDQSLNCSTSTNQRAEWFLSTSHWQDFIPLHIQEEELSSINQDSELSLSLVSSDPLSNQSKGTSSDSHVIVRSESPRMELCIYEEIQHKAPKSSAEDDGSVVGEAKAQFLIYSTNHNADSPLCLNQNTYVDVGSREGVEATKEEGSDIIISTKATQPTYSRWSKSLATNHTDSFLKPRITVVSTSL